MKAVNLIPQDERRGGGRIGGASGGAVYALIGGLVVLVVAFAAYLHTGKTVDDRKAELAAVETEMASLRAQAAPLTEYTAFRALAQARVQTVTSLASSRFDWGDAFGEVARVLPEKTWLTSLTGTVKPGTAINGAGSAGGLRAALPVPAIEIAGCTTSQPNVARTMTALRRIDEVERVTLSSSEKSGSSGAGGDDCRQGRESFPQFQMVVFFEPPEGAATAVAAAGAPGAPGATAAPAAPAAGTTGASTPLEAPAAAEGAAQAAADDADEKTAAADAAGEE